MKQNFKIKTSTLVFLGALFLTLVVFAIAPEIGGIGAISMATLIPVWGIVKEGTFKELSVDEIAKLSEEDQVKYFTARSDYQKEQIKTELSDMVAKAKSGLMSKEDFDKEFDAIKTK